MAKTETTVNNLKINRGTLANIQANLSSIGENELIITTDKTTPIPTTSDEGKVIKVDNSGEYILGDESKPIHFIKLESSTLTEALKNEILSDDYFVVLEYNDQYYYERLITDFMGSIVGKQFASQSQFVLEITPDNCITLGNYEITIEDDTSTFSVVNRHYTVVQNRAKVTNINSESATSGQVLTADGSGGASWQTPADNDTTYTLATGDNNGEIKVTPSTGTAYNVSVKGLGSNAYTSTTIPTTYVKSASKSGNTLTLTTQDDTSVTYTPSDATTSTKGIVSIGNGLSVSNGNVSVDSNVVALQSDLPSGEVDVNFNDTTSTVTTTTPLTNITIVGDTRYTITPGMTNPMTTADDLIIGGSSGTPTRLAKGSTGQVLKVGSNGLEWANESGGSGTGVPTISIALTQITSQDPLQIQLTNEQWAIYTNKNNLLIKLDLSAIYAIGASLFDYAILNMSAESGNEGDIIFSNDFGHIYTCHIYIVDSSTQTIGVYAMFNPIILEDASSNVITLTSTDWANLKANHYLVLNNIHMGGNFTQDALFNEIWIAGLGTHPDSADNEYKVRLLTQHQFLHTTTIIVEDNDNHAYELFIQYNSYSNKIIFRCATVY